MLIILAEQRRIVAKLAQLLQHCEALEQRIRESRQLAGQLLQTALREALAPPAGWGSVGSGSSGGTGLA